MGKIADAIRGTGLSQQKQTQMLALDKQFSEMETEIQTLKTENLHLRAQVRPLEEQIERLKNAFSVVQCSSAKVPDPPHDLGDFMLGHTDEIECPGDGPIVGIERIGLVPVVSKGSIRSWVIGAA